MTATYARPSMPGAASAGVSWRDACPNYIPTDPCKAGGCAWVLIGRFNGPGKAHNQTGVTLPPTRAGFTRRYRSSTTSSLLSAGRLVWVAMVGCISADSPGDSANSSFVELPNGSPFSSHLGDGVYRPASRSKDTLDKLIHSFPLTDYRASNSAHPGWQLQEFPATPELPVVPIWEYFADHHVPSRRLRSNKMLMFYLNSTTNTSTTMSQHGSKAYGKTLSQHGSKGYAKFEPTWLQTSNKGYASTTPHFPVSPFPIPPSLYSDPREPPGQSNTGGNAGNFFSGHFPDTFATSAIRTPALAGNENLLENIETSKQKSSPSFLASPPQ